MKFFYYLILTFSMISLSSIHLASSDNTPINITTFSSGVVYSSDLDIQKANTEINQLPTRLPQYRNFRTLFKRGQWYVSVILFPTQQDANNSLQIVENEYNRGSFVVNIKEWCRPDWSKSKYQTTLNNISYHDCKRVQILPGNKWIIRLSKYDNLTDAGKAIDKLKKDPNFKSLNDNLVIFKQLDSNRKESYYIALINYAKKTEPTDKIRNSFTTKNPSRTILGSANLDQWCSNRIQKNGEEYDYIECLTPKK